MSEKMPKNAEVCLHCGCYKAFYRAGIGNLWQESNGICSERGKVVGQADSCEFWRPPHEKRAATVRALDEAEKEVKTLQRLLKDEL